MISEELRELFLEMSKLPAFVGTALNSVNASGNFGETPLQVAAVQGNTKAARLLLTHGADVNSRGEHGYTALHEAILQGDSDMVRLLVTAGADVNVRDDNGATSLDLAKELGVERILSALTQLAPERDDSGQC